VSARCGRDPFFVGSLLFTSAAYLQYRLSIDDGSPGPRSFVFERPTRIDRLAWAPDALGSPAFPASSVPALLVVRDVIAEKPATCRFVWWSAVTNVFGPIAFGLSALGAVVLPTTGDVANATLVNAGTSAGVRPFFVGALLTLRGTTVSNPEAVAPG
jgi:hypothetical protein